MGLILWDIRKKQNRGYGKYFKYKNKYLQLKNINGSVELPVMCYFHIFNIINYIGRGL